MKRTSFVAICAILLFSIVNVNVNGQEKSCKEAVSDLTKRQLKRISECTTKLKFKNGKEKNERKTCIMRCVFEIEGLLDSDGQSDPVGSLVFVEKNLPAASTEFARSVIMGCSPATANLDASEVTCKSYDAMIKCAMGSLNMFCNPPSK